jgi:oligopeptide transport system substrate-binding protein
MTEKIAKARQLYREAGFDPDRPLEIELRTANSDNMRKVAIAIAGMWKSALGIKTTLVSEEFKNLLEQSHVKADLQIFWFTWTADYPDPTTFLDLFTSNSVENDFGYRNPAYDQLIAEAEETAEVNLRSSLLQQAEDLLVADNPVIPLFIRVQPYLAKPWVKGYHVAPTGNTYDRDVTVLPH